MRYLVSEKPTIEPITLHRVREHCRVDDTDEDGFLASMIPAARRHCEQVLGAALLDQAITVEFAPEDFIRRTDKGGYIYELPVKGVTSVTEILNENEGEIDEADYVLSVVSNTIRTSEKVSKVTYRAGVFDPADVSPTVKKAMLLLLGHWYEHRSAVTTEATPHAVQMTVDALLAPERALGL